MAAHLRLALLCSIWYESYPAIQIHEESHSDSILTTPQPSMSPVESYDLLTTFNPTFDTVNFTDSNEEYIFLSKSKHSIERMIQDVRKRIHGLIGSNLVKTSSDSTWQWRKRIWNIGSIISNRGYYCRWICYMEISHSFSKQA